MPIHPAMSSRFPLLESVPSMQALMEDTAYARQRAQFESHPGYQVPEVGVRAAQVPGPYGAVPVRVYDPGPVRVYDPGPVRVYDPGPAQRCDCATPTAGRPPT
jgi:hypothetical protein